MVLIEDEYIAFSEINPNGVSQDYLAGQASHHLGFLLDLVTEQLTDCYIDWFKCAENLVKIGQHQAHNCLAIAGVQLKVSHQRFVSI